MLEARPGWRLRGESTVCKLVTRAKGITVEPQKRGKKDAGKERRKEGRRREKGFPSSSPSQIEREGSCSS